MKDSLDRKDLLKLCDLPCAEWLSGPKDTECLRPMALTGIVETSLCLGLVGQLCVLLILAIELPDCPSSAQLRELALFRALGTQKRIMLK